MSTKNELLDHNYDGIQEYDNPTPGWWHMIFLATIAFSIPYFVIYEMNPDVPTIQDRVALDEKASQAKVLAAIGDVKADAAGVLSLVGQQKTRVIGDAIYKANCLSCHGGKGEGLVGPNMTDEYFKNIKTIGDFVPLIQNGAAGGAMPAWKNRLNEKEIIIMAAYMAGLRGQNLAGPRGAEGVQIAPWSAEPAPAAAAAAPAAPAAQPAVPTPAK